MSTMMHPFEPLDRLFQQVYGGRPEVEQVERAHGETPVLRPRADIHESDREYLVTMDLPGVEKSSLRIEVEGNVLVVEGERKTVSSDDLQALHLERLANVRFLRRFTLGKEVEVEKISAQLRDGVLRLHLPKQAEAQPRRIHVE